jgi:hypothetical protein
VEDRLFKSFSSTVNMSAVIAFRTVILTYNHGVNTEWQMIFDHI